MDKLFRKFAVAGYIILPLQLLLTIFWILQGVAGVSLDYVNLGFGFIPSDYFFSIIFLFSSILLLLFGLSTYWFGRKLNFMSLSLSGSLVASLNAVFLVSTLFQRFARLPDAPFLFGFYQGSDPEWIFLLLRWYPLLNLLTLSWVAVSLIIFGRKHVRKIFIAGMILLLGIILGVLLGFINIGAFSPLLFYVGMPFIARQIRFNMREI
jgi:hypothetical protein